MVKVRGKRQEARGKRREKEEKKRRGEEEKRRRGKEEKRKRGKEEKRKRGKSWFALLLVGGAASRTLSIVAVLLPHPSSFAWCYCPSLPISCVMCSWTFPVDISRKQPQKRGSNRASLAQFGRGQSHFQIRCPFWALFVPGWCCFAAPVSLVVLSSSPCGWCCFSPSFFYFVLTWYFSDNDFFMKIINWNYNGISKDNSNHFLKLYFCRKNCCCVVVVCFPKNYMFLRTCLSFSFFLVLFLRLSFEMFFFFFFWKERGN